MTDLVKVYKINGQLVVANDISSAISVFMEKYPYNEIKSISLIEGDEPCDYFALIRKCN